MMEERSKEKDEMEELKKFVKETEQENFVLKKLLEVEEMTKSPSNTGIKK